MRIDARRALMLQALNTRLAHNSLPNGPDFFRQRAVLRFRTLRMFFCSRGFSTAFFTPSEKFMMRGTRGVPSCCLGTSNSLVSASFSLNVGRDHLRVESLVVILRLAQTDISRLKLELYVFNAQDVSFENVREMALILSAVKGKKIFSVSQLVVQICGSWKG